MVKIAPRRARLIWVLFIIGLGSIRLGAQDAGSEDSLDLFQITARATLVVHVRVIDGSLKYALVEVLAPLKGVSPGTPLRIAFREFNYTRKPGTEPIIFPAGQEEILFLVRQRLAKHDDKNLDLYELFQGLRGRIAIPAEGSEPLVRAIRSLIEVSSRDPLGQAEGLRSLLDRDNPYLLSAALDEIGRLRIATVADFPRLFSLLKSTSGDLRAHAIRLVAQVLSSREGLKELSESDDQASNVLPPLLERARNDGSESVRVAAVIALGAWPARKEVEGPLQAIATQDSSQLVRYEAQKVLLQNRDR